MSEIINIPLGGVSNEPDDYNAEDGGLSVSINAVKHHGSIRPVMPGSQVEDIGDLPEGADVVAIHEVGEMKHYILLWEDTSAGAKPTEVRCLLYYENLPGRVRVSWDTYPKQYDFGFTQDDPSQLAWQMQVSIGPENNVYTQNIEQGKAIEIPGNGLCVGDGTEHYDYENGKVVTDDYITLRKLMSTGDVEELTNLTKVDVAKYPQTDKVPDDADDTEGKYMLMYIDANAENKDAKEIASFSDKVIGVSAMGNVLVIARKGKPLTYVIWKDKEYRKLGSKIEAPRVYPYLHSKPMGVGELYSKFGADFMTDTADTNLIEKDTIDISKWNTLVNSEGYITFNAVQQKYISDKVFAIVNAAHNILTNKGYFYAPFFVRFALRLFDGSHIMHTPPQLMIAGAAGKPLLGVSVDATNALLRPVFMASRLNADIESYNNRWKDIVTHLDVFVSSPLIDYTEANNSIQGAGDTSIGYHPETEDEANATVLNPSSLNIYNPMYMRSRKELGNMYNDFTDLNNKGVYLYMNHLRYGSGLNSFKNPAAKKGQSTGQNQRCLFLIDKTKYPNISITTVSGVNKTLEPFKEDTVVGYASKDITALEETINIYGRDTGITKLSNYVYFELDAFTLSAGYIISGYDTVNITQLWVDATKATEGRALPYMLDIKRTDGTNYRDVIQNNNVFHLVKSIPMEDLTNGWHGDLFIEENILDNLLSRDTLSDNGQMRNRATTTIAPLAYNNRLSVAVRSVTLPSTSYLADYCVQSEPIDKKALYIEKAWVKASVNGQVVYKELSIGTDGEKATYAENIRYFYYPDYNATHLILQVFNKEAAPDIFQVHTYTLDKHKLLNGTYIFNDFDSLIPNTIRTYYTRQELAQDEDIWNAVNGKTEASFGNMVKVSGVSNPFYFNETHQVTLPSGNITGLSTTAKALSQGQFGAFPLYCFSDNGIWALEVSDEGTYSAKQPVSRAVCTSPESITQTDGEVLFVTKRGLMSISGSETSCLSEVLSGHNYTSKISKLTEVMNHVGMQNVEIPTHVEDWLQEAKFLYDDMRQYIYAFRDDDTLGYIYSMSDKAWGMFLHDLAHPLPCYTDALAVTNPDEGGIRKLINLSDYTNCGSAPKSLIITRPLAMGVPDGYKTLEALITRGMLDKDDAHLVIWASNNLKDWAVVATSQTSWYRGASGSPYKYYRIGILLDNWEEEDSISMLSADVTPRLNNRLR